MGIVYAARDSRLNRSVALKMLRGTISDPAAAERLRRSLIQTSAKLYDLGDDAGELYIAMELLEGESLAGRIASGPVPIDESVAITLAPLSALGALHDAGLMHRDLKASNIFLTPSPRRRDVFGRGLGGQLCACRRGLHTGAAAESGSIEWLDQDVS